MIGVKREKKAFRPENGLKKIHLLGAGGAGMSALGRVLLDLGFKVSGCDIKPSSVLEALLARGAQVSVGHDPGHLRDISLLVYSSAVAPDNPELVAARKKIPVWHRSELLAMLMAGKSSVAVAGSHGKTSTAAMIVSILEEAGMNPGFALGGDMINLETNGRWGAGEWFVAEADESDGSFQRLRPDWEVITGMDLDHVDRYPDRSSLLSAFGSFLAAAGGGGGGVIAWAGDRGVVELAPAGVAVLTYGLGGSARLRGIETLFAGGGAAFTVVKDGKKLGRVRLSLPGCHNVINALGAMAFALEIGVPFAACRRALAGHSGCRRRLEIKSRRNGVAVFEDYSHHPAEIRAALHALRSLRPGRLWCVFQPHRFSRLARFAPQMALALMEADRLILTELYPAFEKPLPGVDSEMLLRELQSRGRKDAVLAAPSRALEMVRAGLRPGDTVVVMGAGDIGVLARRLAEDSP